MAALLGAAHRLGLFYQLMHKVDTQTLGSFTLKHTFAPKQISSDPEGHGLAQCAGFFSPLPSLA